MAFRGNFGYDDYYYPTPYNYSYPYYEHPGGFREYDLAEQLHPSSRSYSARAPARNGGASFRDAEMPEPATRHRRPRSSSRPVSIPIQVDGPDSEPKGKTAAAPKKRAEEAAVTVQAAARGLLARRMMREVRAVEREAEAVADRVAAESEALRADSRARIGVGEELMRLLLRLDAVRGVREFRRRVTKKVLALQDAVDALEAGPAQAASAAADSLAAETVEMFAAVESAMAPELPQIGEQGVQIGANIAADSSAVEPTAEVDMEVDGARAEEADSAATETIAAESTMVDEEQADPAATETIAAESTMVVEEAEWEMVTGDDEGVIAGEPKAQPQEAAGEEAVKKTTEAAPADGLDAKKVMEMLAVLCERSAKQCELIGALAERVDTLERAVRRVEEADRRRRTIKKIKEEGKINSSFYNDC